MANSAPSQNLTAGSAHSQEAGTDQPGPAGRNLAAQPATASAANSAAAQRAAKADTPHPASAEREAAAPPRTAQTAGSSCSVKPHKPVRDTNGQIRLTHLTEKGG